MSTRQQRTACTTYPNTDVTSCPLPGASRTTSQSRSPTNTLGTTAQQSKQFLAHQARNRLHTYWIRPTNDVGGRNSTHPACQTVLLATRATACDNNTQPTCVSYQTLLTAELTSPQRAHLGCHAQSPAASLPQCYQTCCRRIVEETTQYIYPSRQSASIRLQC